MKNEPATPAVLIVLVLVLAGYALTARSTLPSEGQLAWRDGGCAACHRLDGPGNDLRRGPGGRLGPNLSGVVSRRGRAWVEHVLTTGAPGMPPSSLDPVRHSALMALLEAGGDAGLER